MNTEDLQAQAQDEEVGLPRAALNKLIKDTLPNVRVANETRDLIYNCCLDYIKAVGSSANRHCAEEQRKTIGAEHVIKALEELGFGPEYVEAANSVMDNCRQQAARRLRRQNSRLDKLGIPEEELLRQQQELFQKAREEQAEADQAQLAHFQQLMASVQQQQQSVFNPAAFLAAGRATTTGVGDNGATPSTTETTTSMTGVYQPPATLPVPIITATGSTSELRMAEGAPAGGTEDQEGYGKANEADEMVPGTSGFTGQTTRMVAAMDTPANSMREVTASTTTAVGGWNSMVPASRMGHKSSVMDDIDEDYDED